MHFIVLITLIVYILHVISAKPANEWDVIQWWFENNDYQPNVNKVQFVTRKSKPVNAFLANSGSAPDYKKFLVNRNRNPEAILTEFNEQIIPQSSARILKSIYEKYFTRVRSYRRDRKYYSRVKNAFLKYFASLGLITAKQEFWPPEMVR